MPRRRPTLLAAAVLAILCAWWRGGIERDVQRLWTDDARIVVPFADAVAAAVADGSDAGWFHTGSARFDGEWALGTCTMASVGLARVVRARPELRTRYAPAAEACGRWLLSPEGRAFGTEAWGEDGLDPADPDHGHLYLGWLALGLGGAAEVSGDPDLVRAHDALVATLAGRLARLPVHRLETYPGEVYPPDIAVTAAAVAWHGGHEAELTGFWPRFEAAALDPETGLLVQALSARGSGPVDLPRGSGSALAASLLAEANPALSRRLADAVHTHLDARFLGHGAVREVPPDLPGRADIDSGPVILGVSVSATGFALGAARVRDDATWHRALARTAHTFGVPVRARGSRRFLTGGSLGNAILLAMWTTPRARG